MYSLQLVSSARVQYSRLYGIIYESPVRNVDIINYLHHTRRNIVIVISIRRRIGQQWPGVVAIEFQAVGYGPRDWLQKYINCAQYWSWICTRNYTFIEFCQHTFERNLWDNFTSTRKYSLYLIRSHVARWPHLPFLLYIQWTHDHTKYIFVLQVFECVFDAVVVYWIDISNGRKYNLYFITVFTGQIKAKLKCNMNITGKIYEWMTGKRNPVARAIRISRRKTIRKNESDR